MNYIRPDSGVARSKLNSMVTVFSVYTTYTCTVASEKKAAEECRNMQIMVVPFFLFCLVTILLLFFPQYSLSLSLSLSPFAFQPPRRENFNSFLHAYILL